MLGIQKHAMYLHHFLANFLFISKFWLQFSQNICKAMDFYNIQHIGKASTVRRDTSAGRKVGQAGIYQCQGHSQQSIIMMVLVSSKHLSKPVLAIILANVEAIVAHCW